MEDAKKWLVVLRRDQYDWIKKTSKSMGIKGTHIVRAMIDKLMDNEVFISSLANEKWKIEYARLQDQKLVLEERETELKKHLKGVDREKVAA